MKTKTKKAPEVVAGEGYKQLFAGEVNLANIQVRSNFRKTFNEKLLKELSNNIAKVGVLQPVILRQVGEGFPKPAVDGDFILVAGERRLRAAALAGLTKIPASVLDLNEEQAAEVQALENLHRKDLSPIEEARAFKVLLDQKGHTLEQVQDLADRVGKSANYVYRAIRLLELPKDVLEKIESGEWTAAHGHQLLRVPKEKIKEVIQEASSNYYGGDDSTPTATQFKNAVDHELGQDLHAAGFPKTIEYAGKPACSGCVYNSGNQDQLFEGIKEGTCSDGDCFEIKEKQHKEDQLAKIKEKYGANFLGVSKGYISSGSRAGGGNIIGTIDDKETKAAQKDPETKYVCSEGGNIYVIHNDKAIIKKALGYLPGGGEASGTVHGTTPKQKFVRMETYKALFMAARAACSKGCTKEQLAFIAEQLEPGHYNTHIPEQILEAPMHSRSWGGKRPAYNKMSAEQLRDMVLLFALDKRSATSQDPDAKAFTAVGVDVKKVKEIAKKTAEAAWEAKKAAKKAKPAKKGAKPEPEIDSDQDNE